LQRQNDQRVFGEEADVSGHRTFAREARARTGREREPDERREPETARSVLDDRALSVEREIADRRNRNGVGLHRIRKRTITARLREHVRKRKSERGTLGDADVRHHVAAEHGDQRAVRDVASGFEDDRRVRKVKIGRDVPLPRPRRRDRLGRETGSRIHGRTERARVDRRQHVVGVGEARARQYGKAEGASAR